MADAIEEVARSKAAQSFRVRYTTVRQSTTTDSTATHSSATQAQAHTTHPDTTQPQTAQPQTTRPGTPPSDILLHTSLYWENKWTWKHPDLYTFCELQAIEWQLLQLSSTTSNIIWMALRRGEEEARIDSAEVDMP